MKVEFFKSSSEVGQCPPESLPEYAFIGRSNVGKSSLINSLTGRKKLAKTSATPGKTQLINHFKVDDSWYLVDLPGYGWARTSKENKKSWEKMIYEYLVGRKNLLCVFLLIDSKIPPQQIDIDFMNWMGENQIPFAIVYTKIDKLTKNKIAQNIQKLEKEYLKYWEELPPRFSTSSVKDIGKEEVLNFIQETNQVFKPF